MLMGAQGFAGDSLRAHTIPLTNTEGLRELYRQLPSPEWVGPLHHVASRALPADLLGFWDSSGVGPGWGLHHCTVIRQNYEGMLPETEEQVEGIRKRIKDAQSLLDEARVRFGDNKDEYLQEQLKHAHYWLNDVDTLFLSMLKEDRFPPRSLSEEMFIVTGALTQLESVAVPQIHRIVEWSVKLVRS